MTEQEWMLVSAKQGLADATRILTDIRTYIPDDEYDEFKAALVTISVLASKSYGWTEIEQ